MKAKRLSEAEAQRQSVDRITTLPETIIETILCLLPIKEASRTSILSSKWRYKWTKIPKLEFFEDTVSETTTKKKQDSKQSPDVASARKNMDTRCKLFYAIHQVLLLHQGPIHEFALWINADKTCSEIDQIILHLSRNHSLKKFELDLMYDLASYEIPSSLFSMRHLTDLQIGFCVFKQKQIINGFGNLTHLSLVYVRISKENLLHLLSNCPSLKSFCLNMANGNFFGRKYPSVMELFKCLPMIEQLTICGFIIPALVQASVPEELSASLIHLKYCTIEQIGLINIYELTFLVVLLKCSPNLEKINLELDTEDVYDENTLKDCFALFEEYSDVWLEHLNELKIDHFTNFKHQLEFLKFVIARSPNLKMVVLSTYLEDKNEELELLKILLCSTRVSPVKIVVENCYKG